MAVARIPRGRGGGRRTGPYTSGNSNSSGNSGGNSGISGNTAAIEVTGMPLNTEFQEFNSWLRQELPGVRYLKIHMREGACTLIVNQNDVHAFQTLHGKNMKKHTVNVTVNQTVAFGDRQRTSGKPLTAQHKQRVQQAIQDKYDAKRKVMDLTAWSEIDVGNRFCIYAIVDAINECKDVQSLSLANNRLVDFQAWSRLAQNSTLQNLSLEGNNVTDLAALAPLAAGNLRENLREIILSNNPVAAQENYKVTINSMFPNLSLLDAQPVVHVIKFDVPPIRQSLPIELNSYFCDDQTQKLVIDFVGKFFAVYDVGASERQKLLPVYTESSQFSLSCAADGEFVFMPSEYTSTERNIITKKVANIKTGPVAIVYVLSTLPPSKHDIVNFVADANIIPSTKHTNIISLNLKGNFLENNDTLRSFHRTFLLVPPNAEAKSKGWPAVVLNEQLFIGQSKPYADPNTSADLFANLSAPVDQNMVQQLAQSHGITILLASQALEASSNDVAMANQMILTYKANQTVQ